ncbi:MAG: VIT domain-containing protein [Bacteroidales bacterium]
MKKIILIVFIITSWIINIQAYSWLYVGDPQDWQKSGQGSIDEVLLTVEPKGNYMEYGLYLTFSAASLGFTAEDTLEVSYYFSLPEGSIVHDSWLWVEDSIVPAKIMDRWSAYQIYEGIVKRRQDPSVLYKDWQNNYQLRIFPMSGNGKRKVKITYLVPVNWSSKNISAPLPLDILEPSLVPVENIKIVNLASGEWKNPSVLGYPELKFNVEKKKGALLSSQMVIGKSYFKNNMQIAYNSPLNNGIFISIYETPQDGFYQMAFVPSQVFGIKDQRKVLIMFDFERDNSYYTNGNNVFYALQTTLLNILQEGDFFNILLSGQKMALLAPDWIPADSASIASAFKKLGENPVSAYSDLPELLETGIKFLNAGGNKGEILLLSNSDNYGENKIANELFEKIKELGPLPVFHVVDFYDRYYTWYNIGNHYFRGNQYFYTMLTRQSGGNYYEYSYWNNTVDEIIEKAFADMGGILSSFDLHTTLDNGFCHSRYNNDKENPATYLRKPVVQVGKYHGDFPFVIKASGIYNGEIKSVELTFQEPEIFKGDSLLEEMWTGNYIQSLENSYTYDNKIIQSVIDASLNERVLSRYTAFLALEPGMEANIDPQDPGSGSGGLTENSVALNAFGDATARDVTVNKNQEFRTDEIQIRSFPNPFSSVVIIQIALPDNAEWRRVKVEVFDVTGRKIKEFTPDDYNYNGYINIEWDGQGKGNMVLDKGLYSIVVTGDTYKKQMKILKIN